MDVDWKSIPWQPHKAESLQGVLSELQRELAPAHILFGLKVTPIALGYDGDDVLFELEDGRYAVVHLTWSCKTEPYDDCPSTVIYPSLAEFAEAERKAAERFANEERG